MASPRRPDTYANAIRDYSPDAVRYVLNVSVVMTTEEGQRDIQMDPFCPHFVNILTTDRRRYLIEVTCPGGEVVKGHVSRESAFPFRIHDPKGELYDGRFNV